SKLIRVAYGSVRDVVVDLRKDEPTYSQHYAIDLSSENNKILLIPRGFAHGFICKSETVIFSYKCDSYYSKSHETGINPLDRNLGIDWSVDKKDMILSEKDRNAPLWGEHKPY
ncbi:MAG: dTDP-4-dehydrorhamnose 3,5-epimerase, partial [Bacteroidia bacterium]|nr:dTDP-4-dehydrorhamnose 3,5-epimerase [Bacteroidia bacterium]